MRAFIKTLIIASAAIASVAVAEAKTHNPHQNGQSTQTTIQITYDDSGSVREVYSDLKWSSRAACRKMMGSAGLRKVVRCQEFIMSEVINASNNATLIAFHDAKTNRRRQSFRLASLF